MEPLRAFFSEQLFMPHGHCYLWTPALVWLQVLSNAAIGIAYVAISVTLGVLVSRFRKLPFRWIYVAFGIFIVTCGLTHFMDVLVIWQPRYWLDGALRGVTAIASVGTAILLPRLLPQVTALVRGAELMRERGIALQAAVHDLDTLYKKTRDLDRAKTSFFANVSHELRTPLTLILGPLENVLATHTLPQAQHRDLEIAARNARALLRHVNDLLDVAKLEVAGMKPSYAAVDLADVVRGIALSFEALARERRIRFDIATPVELRAEVDEAKLQRVVLNLLSNAFKFVPDGGVVRVSLLVETTQAGAKQARIEVADSGPGIHDEDVDVIFEPFRQGDGSASRAYGGTGLGLAIVREFVELHGGSVRVGRAEEGGASFEVRLPVEAPHAVVASEAPSLPQAHVSAVVEELATKRVVLTSEGTGDDPRPLVLVVEDNADMRELVGNVLAARYRVAFGVDGVDGLKKARELGPDLVISDVMMPNATGEQLVHGMRSDEAFDRTPILMLSAKSDDELRTRLLEHGAQDYVLKPFSAAELRARVDNLVIMKRARDVLQTDLEQRHESIESLSRQVMAQQRHLRDALEAARVAREHAERASEAKNDFLSLVSHELRTPLTNIQLQLRRLHRETSAPQAAAQAKAVEKMERSVRRLDGLIESLLEFARINARRMEIRPEPVDIGEIARDVLDELRDQAEQKQLETRVTCASELRRVTTDARLVRLMVTNLVENAIKYTEQGHVEVRVEPADGGVRVCVVDSGPGIASELHERVFDPFTQLEPLRQKGSRGVGLGLALVRSVASAMGADVALSSEPGRGSAFSVTLRDAVAMRVSPAAASSASRPL